LVKDHVVEVKISTQKTYELIYCNNQKNLVYLKLEPHTHTHTHYHYIKKRILLNEIDVKQV
jgi:ATP sulfurylase